MKKISKSKKLPRIEIETQVSNSDESKSSAVTVSTPDGLIDADSSNRIEAEANENIHETSHLKYIDKELLYWKKLDKIDKKFMSVIRDKQKSSDAALNEESPAKVPNLDIYDEDGSQEHSKKHSGVENSSDSTDNEYIYHTKNYFADL
ncbi:MAG: hypothetical protein MHMPM18_000115 [Marteilia pararefringens]